MELGEIYELDEIALDADGEAYFADSLLVLTTAEEMSALRDEGLLTDDLTELESLDLQMAKVSSPEDLTLEELAQLISQTAREAMIDVDHLYSLQEDESVAAPADQKRETSRIQKVAPVSNLAEIKIGLIDSDIDLNLTAFAKARIHLKDFVLNDTPRPQAHGTAIASILVANSGDYQGLVPQAELYAASVFFRLPDGRLNASTASLVRALDWMSDLDLDVINMSLAGPSNLILERTIKKITAQGTPIVAAVGNAGPHAAPRYPAAYAPVIAVTAVSTEKTIYRMAVRGPHIDFAAPGVAVENIGPGDRFQTSTGTSFAAPYVTAILGIDAARHGDVNRLVTLRAAAEDLGEPGFDTIYGFGLIQLPASTPFEEAVSSVTP